MMLLENCCEPYLETVFFAVFNRALKNQIFCLGGLSQGKYLFPFRTEQSSPVEPMVPPRGGRVGSRQDKVFELL